MRDRGRDLDHAARPAAPAVPAPTHPARSDTIPRGSLTTTLKRVGAPLGHGRIVIAVFGPTAAGRAPSPRRSPARGEVVSCDSMQVYRGLPILTDQPARPTRLVGIWPLDDEVSVAEYAGARTRGDRRAALARTDSGRGRRHRSLPPGRARRARRAAGAGARRARALGPRSTTGARTAAHRRARRALDPAAAAAVHPNDRRRVVRALELAEAGLARCRPTTASGPTTTPASDADRRPRRAARTRLRAGSTRARRRCSTRGGGGGARGARTAGLVTARKAHRPARGRRAAHATRRSRRSSLRTRRYAAYQRKWMRRIPGIVSVTADRSRRESPMRFSKWHALGQRLPARRAG